MFRWPPSWRQATGLNFECARAPRRYRHLSHRKQGSLHSSNAPAGVRSAVPLAAFTTLRVGRSARWLMTARTVDDVERAHRWSEDVGLSLFVLGGGSNLVIADAGFDGVVLHLDIGGLTHQRDGNDTLVTVGAGAPWDATVASCVDRGLAGLECLSGIPGTVGGTPIQNVGAYGQEVAGSIDQLTAYDRQIHAVCRLPGGECGFAYRTSRFKKGDAARFVICDV